jgi:penicillin-binding protein 2
VDLPGEASGVMPSEEWKLKNFHEKWFAGETISVGIGQGAVAVTPIQLARAIGGIASGGTLHRPRFVASDSLPEEFRALYQQRAKDSGIADEVKVPIDPANWEMITDAMAEVVAPGGTAAASVQRGIDIAGKTGSAQVVSNSAKARLGGGKALKDNGWFAGVAPRRNPEVVVVALLEGGEHGSLAARAAVQVIRAYVDKQRIREHNAVLSADDAPKKPVEVGAVWTGTEVDGHPKLNGGNMQLAETAGTKSTSQESAQR